MTAPAVVTPAHLTDDGKRALLDAAAAVVDTFMLSDVADWLRARAAGCTCGDPKCCIFCDAVLCPACNVGDKSSCDHVDGVLCVGCDIDYCRTCSAEHGEEQQVYFATDGRLP